MHQLTGGALASVLSQLEIPPDAREGGHHVA